MTVTVRRRWLAPLPLMLAAMLITAACGDQSDAAPSGGTVNTAPSDASPTAPVPFETFLASVSSATYQDYASQPGVRVRDSSAFEQMRSYILSKYRAARVDLSLTDASGAVFDCIHQPSATTSSPGSGCPSGSIPTRRVTLADLVRFPTLDDFLGKSPGGGGLPPIPSSSSS